MYTQNSVTDLVNSGHKKNVCPQKPFDSDPPSR